MEKKKKRWRNSQSLNGKEVSPILLFCVHAPAFSFERIQLTRYLTSILRP